MGAWGHKYEECDDYLDWLCVVLRPLINAVKKSSPNRDDSGISAAGLLYDILSGKRLFYGGDEENVKMVIRKLEEYLKSNAAFESYECPSARKRVVGNLKKNFEILIRQRPRHTSLFKKHK